MSKPIAVHIIVGAERAYATIKTSSRALDVALAPGKGAAASLRESAQELREKIARLQSQADLMEQASAFLEDQCGL